MRVHEYQCIHTRTHPYIHAYIHAPIHILTYTHTYIHQPLQGNGLIADFSSDSRVPANLWNECTKGGLKSETGEPRVKEVELHYFIGMLDAFITSEIVPTEQVHTYIHTYIHT
jgi:hypothetical protein